MKTELANYLNGETEALKRKQRQSIKKAIVFTVGQIATLHESLRSHREFLGEMLASGLNKTHINKEIRAERKAVARLLKKLENLPY